MNTQIPLYRAKKINSDEYAHGWLVRDVILSEINETETRTYKIDPSTLSIHFPDMIDSKGNKIFASLSEDGKGGDLLEVLDCEDANYVARYDNYSFQVYAILPERGDWEFDSFENCDVKAIGIKQ